MSMRLSVEYYDSKLITVLKKNRSEYEYTDMDSDIETYTMSTDYGLKILEVLIIILVIKMMNDQEKRFINYYPKFSKMM